jgi:hypothetical protein
VNKRTAIISVILLAFGLAVIGYFIQQGRSNLFTDPYKAVSQKACIVIETVDLQNFMNSLSSSKGLIGEAGKIRELDSFNRKLKFLTDLLNKEEVKKLLTEEAALISFYPGGNDRLVSLLSMAVTGHIRLRHIKEILLSSGCNTLIDTKLGGISVLKIPFTINSQRDTVFISLVSGLLICSDSQKIINEATLQMSRGDDIRKIPGFSRVLMTSGKKEDKIFLVFSNLPQLFKTIMGTKGQSFAGRIARLAGTAGGDIYINEDGIVLSGYTECTDSSEFLYRYKYLTPKELHTSKILPSSTMLFETLILPAGGFAVPRGTTASPEAFELALKLRAFTGEEVTRSYIDLKENPVSDNTLIIYELNNRVQAEQLFLDELDSHKEISYFEPDDQTKIPVYKTGYKGFSKILLPGFAEDFDDTYFAFYDNFMITGSSFITISRLLYDNLLNKTLANELSFRDFESTLPSRAGYFFYCVPSHIIDYLTGIFNDNIIQALKSNKSSIDKIQAVGYQLAASNDMIYNSVSVRYKEDAREESTTEWETLLDTTASIKPFFFTNHISGAKEIFIQDMKNSIYLINAAGRVLWKVPMNERITSPIYMIDYFRNGKYQLLFSGRNFIHVIDRNGNYVERYPVRLRSPATNSMVMFDYDNNRNYRLFVAGEDKMIYSYEKTGSVVKGWTPFRTTGIVRADINYFKVSGKDYLVVSDEYSIYFLDRKGKQRFTLKEPVTKARGSAIRLSPGSDPYLVCSSPDGTILNISFDGSIKKFSLREFSADHSFDYFDVDGNGFGEYIFIDKGILYLYDHNRSKIFSRNFDSVDLGGPISFIFSSSDRKIGVFDIDKKLIYLIGKNGETMNGFPLRGASMFSIGKLSEKSGWHLIVGGTDRFLYNYKLDLEIK